MGDTKKELGHVLNYCRVYDKTRPEGQQDVAILQLEGPYVAFVCQHSKEGINVLNKQHAVEFATMMLTMALQLPGDIPDGDIRWGIPESGNGAS